jgi:predicted nuclease of restriction endonuclease-like (RecB) superfamily
MTQLSNQINENSLFSKVAELLELARKQVVTAVNLTMVHTYFEIGKMIIEEEQQGEIRATYGKGILKDLSKRLTERFGKGFSVENLDRMRFFYKVYATPISSTVLTKLENTLPQSTSDKSKNSILSNINLTNDFPKFQLSWSHYLILMRIENHLERKFYEIESIQNQWSLKELQRQCNSSLFERLALSQDKSKVKKLAEKGQIVSKSKDIIKDPYILEFLGLKEKESYSETQLETKIIDHLQHFLLELGKGYTFVGRQERFTFDEKHYRVDLVFYNRLLRSFVLFDLKIGEVKHQDLGQMQMYVNYYDRFIKTEEEHPSIGIILCQKKNDALVELTLPKDSNIYASEYSLYLPEKELLQQKLIEWVHEFEEENL